MHNKMEREEREEDACVCAESHLLSNRITISSLTINPLKVVLNGLKSNQSAPSVSIHRLLIGWVIHSCSFHLCEIQLNININ